MHGLIDEIVASETTGKSLVVLVLQMGYYGNTHRDQNPKENPIQKCLAA
jgi:hypothetical protein